MDALLEPSQKSNGRGKVLGKSLFFPPEIGIGTLFFLHMFAHTVAQHESRIRQGSLEV